MKKTRKQIIAILLVSSLLVTSLTGCGKKPKTPPTSSNNQNQTTSQNSSQDAVTTEINPFTGLPSTKEALTNRPVAIMVNNIIASLPQAGISSADIIFELPVEGPITRLMAVFADYTKMPKMGSIRSARHDYVELMKPFNPIYVHFGGSAAGTQAIKDNKIQDIDGISMSRIGFVQDKKRAETMAREHTWFTDVDHVKAAMTKLKIGGKVTQPTKNMFEFSDSDTMASYEKATPATSATVKMSGSCTATFTYDEATKLYKKGQYGKPHIDTNVNKACAVKNVLVMYTEVGLLPNGKNKEVNLSKGKGFYLSNGKKIDVTFEKKSVNDYLSVKDSQGNPLKLNKGQTWVSIAPIGNYSATAVK
ncbi:MAG: DUF3048 domain-containing protein [Oscillospiraceae bacterium]